MATFQTFIIIVNFAVSFCEHKFSSNKFVLLWCVKMLPHIFTLTLQRKEIIISAKHVSESQARPQILAVKTIIQKRNDGSLSNFAHTYIETLNWIDFGTMNINSLIN